MKEILISQNEANQRLDKFLKKYFKAANTSFLYKMMRKKNITLNKKKVSGDEHLLENDTIQVFFSDDTFEKMRGLQENNKEYEAISKLSCDLSILYENKDILVVNKPAGILSQKAEANDISMNEYIISYLIHSKQCSEEEFSLFKPSVANRLDRNTSGLLLAGKTLHGAQELGKMLKNRSVIKMYHCICAGRFEEDLKLNGYLLKDKSTNKVNLTSSPQKGAKAIHTSISPVTYIADMDASLVQVHLITGRTHQIRAHLASIGHPIAGDPKYGDVSWNEELRKEYGINRQLLHAYSLTFLDGQMVVAPYPKDMKQLI